MQLSGVKVVFQGSSALTLDAKGRISIPTRHRDALMSQADGRLTLTRHPDGCLLVYPRPEWEKRASRLPPFPCRPALQRLLLGNAQDVELDGSGRVLIAPELRNASGMTRDVMLLGLGAHFELWDAATLASREAEDLAKGMPDVLNQFRSETAMEFEHRPVLLEPTVDALLLADFGGKGASRSHPQSGRMPPLRAERGVFVDGTLGRGGHSRELLSRLGPQARLVVFDKDPQAIAVATALAAEDSRVEVVHGGFATMAEELRQRGIDKVDGVMLDLGVLASDRRCRAWFLFMRDGPLDMRMDTTRGPTVADWLAQASVDEMREVIADYGEERFAFQVAKAIAARRATRPLRTTLELAECVASAVTREKGQHPATRTFQALRIYINRELEELARTLASALDLLAPGGWR